jgi:hypothetical protein
MVSRVGDYVRVHQRHEENSKLESRSRFDVPYAQHVRPAQHVGTSTPENDTLLDLAAGGGSGADEFSLELEDLWNMVISSDAWTTQDFSAT